MQCMKCSYYKRNGLSDENYETIQTNSFILHTLFFLVYVRQFNIFTENDALATLTMTIRLIFIDSVQ